MKLLAMLRRLDSRLRNRKHGAAQAAFEAAVTRLQPGDVAIDCGANVGKFTVPMARTGATVYAFEPNPHACAKLQQAVGSFPNVTVLQSAASTSSGEVRLLMHRRAASDPVQYSTSSTLVGGKRNVDETQYTLVQAVDFADFVSGLGGRPVRLLKMDIEGAEVGVLNRLLDAGLHERIEQAFVEVHDRQNPSLAEPTRQLRLRLAGLGASQFRLDWR